MTVAEIEGIIHALVVKVSVQNAKWEYTSTRLHVDAEMGEDQRKMTEMGQRGWELVSIIPNVYPEPGKSFEAFFKRRT